MRLISLNLTSVSPFPLAVFICRCASATLSKRIGSAVDAHQQRGRCASANNFAVQKQGKRCVEMTNRTAHTASATRMAWSSVADTGRYGLLYAVSATKSYNITMLPSIGGGWQVEKGKYSFKALYVPADFVNPQAMSISISRCEKQGIVFYGMKTSLYSQNGCDYRLPGCRTSLYSIFLVKG